RRDLTEQDEDELYELFARIPDLELPYCFREDVAEIFDTAKNRQEASARLEELRAVIAGEAELLEFYALYDRWRDGILAYFDRRETSAAVEGLNTKARVITRRSYGLKSADSLWRRLSLEVNRFGGIAHRTVSDLHALARGIQATFRGYYT
ncbi:MAG TPA: transposase, partial [Pirellulales bacterium]|nr:transposase [Pirellulales bacterium]